MLTGLGTRLVGVNDPVATKGPRLAGTLDDIPSRSDAGAGAIAKSANEVDGDIYAPFCTMRQAGIGLNKSARIVGACTLWSRVRSFKDQ